MLKARDTGKPVVTTRIKLVQESSEQFGLLMLQAIYDKNTSQDTLQQRRQNLMGFALGVFSIGDMVEKSLADFTQEKAGIDLYVYDESANTEESFLYFHPSRARAKPLPPITETQALEKLRSLSWKNELHHTTTIDVAGRKWLLVLTPTPEYIAARKSWEDWEILGGGLLFTGMLSLYLWNNIDRTAQIEKLVQERTNELSKTNQALEIEIVERHQAQENLRQSEAAIRELYEVTTAREVPFEERLQGLLTIGRQWFEMEVGIFSQIKPIEADSKQEMQYEIVAAQSPHSLISKGDIFDLKQTYCYETVQASEPICVESTANKGRDPVYAGSAQLPIQSYLGIPVMVSGLVYGTLNFSSSKPRQTACKALEIELLKLMAQWVGGALERQLAAEELERSRDKALAGTRAKSEFLATMSHEIRTPMNGVIGMTGVLLNTNLTPQQIDFVETIRSSGDALLTIINDILDFSKIESGKLELEKQPFVLRNCIEDVLDLLATKAAEKGLELAYQISPSTPQAIMGDMTRLRQILLNLLSNAVKFTDTGEVIVSVSASILEGQNYQLQFSVRDTGIGIPDHKRERLFQPFSQVDASTTRKYGGTGLGLVVSKRLSEIMGGTMWVESKVDHGSTFYFTMIIPSAPDFAPVKTEEYHLQLAGKKLLIVGDNATNRKILTLQAQSWGMESFAAQSGFEALEWLRQNPHFDLAILDMQMPEMDGLTLAAKIRQLPRYQDLPLVMLTSIGMSEVSKKAQDLNFAAFLNKPIKQSQLYNVLSGILVDVTIRWESSQSKSCQIETNLAQKFPLRILLAEDNLVNQKVALNILQRMGYRADIAANGFEVLEALYRQSYDVVLMDVQMPEMDGLTATRQICSQWKRDQRPQIIAMTANAMEGDRELCLEAGMDNYLSKPIRIQELIEVLEKCHSNQEIVMEKNSAIDVEVLALLYDPDDENSSEFMVEVINDYLEDAANLVADIKNSIVKQDAGMLRHMAHSLKSTSASLGAIKFSNLCKKIEAISRSGNTAKAGLILPEFEAEYQRVTAGLQVEIQKYSGL